MLKLLLLTVVFTFFGVKESNAYLDFPDLKWSEGSAINEPVGPENAIYCRLDNSRSKTVVDGFGPCRIVVDRVTPEHMGYWRIWYAAPGMVAAKDDYFHVEVITPADEPELVVTSSVVRNDSSVVVTCSVPQEHEIVSCIFRDPSGDFWVASREEQTGTRYSSVAGPNDCFLRLLEPEKERAGIWRCAVQTIRDTGYSFPHIYNTILSPEEGDYDLLYQPVLQARRSVIEGSEGSPTTMFCTIEAPIRYCYYRSTNGTVINLSSSTSTADYEYMGNGLESGECGIRVKNLQQWDQGQWSCNVAQVGHFSEERETIYVYVNDAMTVKHHWLDSRVVVSMHITSLPKLEYCRYVRNDGLGFVSDNVPPEYIFNEFITSAQGRYGCELIIPRPQAVDLRPWTVVAKVVGEDTERSVRTTFDSRSFSGGSSSTFAVIMWCSLGTLFLFVIIVSCLPKKNREWTARRAARIRNSFRRQPHPQPPQIVVNVPNQHIPPPIPQPIHNDVLTDLPRKV